MGAWLGAGPRRLRGRGGGAIRRGERREIGRISAGDRPEMREGERRGKGSKRAKGRSEKWPKGKGRRGKEEEELKK